MQKEGLAWDAYVCHLITFPSSLKEKPWPNCPEIQSCWCKHQPNRPGRSLIYGHGCFLNSAFFFWLSSACKVILAPKIPFFFSKGKGF